MFLFCEIIKLARLRLQLTEVVKGFSMLILIVIKIGVYIYLEDHLLNNKNRVVQCRNVLVSRSMKSNFTGQQIAN